MIFDTRFRERLTQTRDISMYGPPMAGERGSVDYYLERALLARLEAEKSTDQDVKDELLRLAVAFETLAARKDKTKNKKQPDR